MKLGTCATAMLAVLAASCGKNSGGGVTVAISPRTASVAAGATQQFTATVTGTADAGINWSVTEASGGSVNAVGLYPAPSAAVTVTAPVSVAVSPKTKSVIAGGTIAFSAAVSGSSNTAVTWSVAGGASAGTINPTTGVYTAPGTAGGPFTVTATSAADTSKS